MTKPDSKPPTKPLWVMQLNGLPCDHCWEPADYMAVYERGRAVVHVNRELVPCLGANPKPVAPKAPALPRAAYGPKRKVGRPKDRKN